MSQYFVLYFFTTQRVKFPLVLTQFCVARSPPWVPNLFYHFPLLYFYYVQMNNEKSSFIEHDFEIKGIAFSFIISTT